MLICEFVSRDLELNLCSTHLSLLNEPNSAFLTLATPVGSVLSILLAFLSVRVEWSEMDELLFSSAILSSLHQLVFLE